MSAQDQRLISPACWVYDSQEQQAQGVLGTELLFGTRVTILGQKGDLREIRVGKEGDPCGYHGFAWGGAFRPEVLDTPNYWVSVPRAYTYAEPGASTSGPYLYLNSRVRIERTSGDYALISGLERWVLREHLRELGDWLSDPLEVARQFVGTDYLWGGCTIDAIDCSAVPQQAFQACGIAIPRNSSDQRVFARFESIEFDALEPGDLLFWGGHVAFVDHGQQILHAAGGYYRRVLAQPLKQALDERGPPMCARRLKK